MVIGLIVFLSLITIVVAIAMMVLFGEENNVLGFICAIVACFTISAVVAIGTINSDRNKEEKVNLKNREFQSKLVQSYKEKYGQDEDINSYEKFIEDYNKNK